MDKLPTKSRKLATKVFALTTAIGGAELVLDGGATQAVPITGNFNEVNQTNSFTISITGVPASSHFARVMVAADFRMKRLAMNFQPAPMDNMPSFLSRLGA